MPVVIAATHAGRSYRIMPTQFCEGCVCGGGGANDGYVCRSHSVAAVKETIMRVTSHTACLNYNCSAAYNSRDQDFNESRQPMKALFARVSTTDLELLSSWRFGLTPAPDLADRSVSPSHQPAMGQGADTAQRVFLWAGLLRKFTRVCRLTRSLAVTGQKSDRKPKKCSAENILGSEVR